MNGRTVVFTNGHKVTFKAPPCDYGPRWLHDEAVRCSNEFGPSGAFTHRCVRDARKGSTLCAPCAKKRGL